MQFFLLLSGPSPILRISEMESLSVRNLISATHNTFPIRRPVNPFRIRRFHLQIRHFRFVVSSKQSYFQDFQDYAKPLRLLPTAEVQDHTGASLEKIPSLFRKDGSKSLYKVKIQTSSIYGSGLSDINAGVLLCLIDENGDSILQRIPASSMKDHPSTSKDSIVSETLHFQRGSVDEFTFEGPKLGKVDAIWISLESGQWRLGGVSLTIICSCESPTEDTDEKESQYSDFHYDFDVEDILLGEGTSLASQGISNEESMREYADLKFSLLLYDTMLIFVGTQIASLSAGEKAGFAFLTGGIGGLLYLLLLQSSGDIPLVLTPRELVVGMMGFLVCKVAVLPERKQVIHFLLFPMLYEGTYSKKTELQLPTMLFLDRYVADKSASLQDPLYLYTKVEPAKIYQMSSAFSLAVKPSVAWSNGKLLSRKSTRRAARAEVIVAPKKRTSTHNVPELSKQGIPHTDLHVREIVKRQSTDKSAMFDVCQKPQFHPMFLEEAYERCRNICAEYAKTFYLGTLLMTEERQKAIWAIYVWCRRTDELVDGPNAAYMSSAVLDRWEERLHDIFNGRPYDMLDAALTDTIYKFPLDIKPFRDMIEGMRMDTKNFRYANFQELYLYCYYVAGTVGLMSVPVMGIAPESPVSAQSIYNSALYLGIGNQLTNILRDVGEDSLRGRVYLPQDELAQFGLCDRDIFSRKVSDGWREFMKQQITRARFYFNQAEEGASQLDKASRWPVWSSLLLYRKILDAIEENDYDNLTKRAYVGRTKKLLMLPLAYSRAQSATHPGLSGTRFLGF
ncbi:hypothetical protein AAG906_032369 [Vitis piasezkii]